jgi:uncharacterized membrane protein (DUF441 family)
MNSYITSIIRTWVPILVGSVISWLATRGLSLDKDTADAATVAATGIIIALYYVVVRLFEKYVSPKFGWLLGVAKTPVYHKPTSD